jgi:hypothetical protein
MFDDEFFKRMDERHRQQDEMFLRLCAEPCMDVAEVGDIVLIAGGLLGKGFLWVRLEATVLAVADTAYKVEFDKPFYDGTKDVQWVHRTLVTDIVREKVKP